MFKAALSDLRKIDAAKTKPLLPPESSAHLYKMDRWLTSRWVKKDDIIATAPSEVLSAGELAQLKLDLAAQGMGSVADLNWMLLVIHTCRPVASTGIAGAKYGTPPEQMVGGQLHRKSKMRTFTEVLDKMDETKDPTEHDEWIRRVGDLLDVLRLTLIRTRALCC